AAIVFPLVSSKNFLSKVGEIGWRSLSRGARAVIVAAAVFAATITASAAVGGITGSTIIENILPPDSPETVTEADSVSEKTSENVSSAEVSVTEASSEKEKTNILRDASIKVKDAEHPEKGYFACYETAGADDVNPKCHHERISFDPDNTVDYPSKFYEKVSDKNTAFNEAEYKKKNCENSVCNSETGELHNFGEWYLTEEPTCTELGKQERVCSVCGTVQSSPVKATGEHLFEYSRAKSTNMDADYFENYKTNDGYIEYKCRYCSKKKKRIIAKATRIVIDQYEFEYDGKKHRPTVYGVLDRNGKVIPKKYYKVYYLDSSNAKDIYNDFGVYAEVSGEKYRQDVEIRFRVIPDTVKLKSVLTGDGTLVPEWKKAAFCENVDKAIYEIQYAKNKDFSDAKTVKAYGDDVEKVITDVEKGETYYVRIRGVSDFSRNLTVPVGHWSEVRKITVE
ncbi:MAG: hypothetical protein K6C14_03965, partial [Eubacterium sp.]|nr:hypothetical protein [Eubacterium sp.]